MSTAPLRLEWCGKSQVELAMRPSPPRRTFGHLKDSYAEMLHSVVQQVSVLVATRLRSPIDKLLRARGYSNDLVQRASDWRTLHCRDTRGQSS